MDLKNAVPWGRSLNEYKEMFSLTECDLQKNILGCSDGPASFNAEVSAMGGSITSFDPIYHFDLSAIKARIGEVYEEVISQVEQNADDFLWDSIKSVQELGEVRMSAMNSFLEDYEIGKSQGRYIPGELPNLPFENEHFDLALCSHFLFLYSEQFSYDFHKESLLNLCSAAKEVRVYPLVNLKNENSPYVDLFLKEAKSLGISVEFVNVAYRFQKGADSMMVLRKV